MKIFKNFSERTQHIRQSEEFRRRVFFNKQRAKLVLFMLPVGFILIYLLENKTSLERSYIALISCSGLIISVNWGAHWLTKKNFKNNKAGNV